MKKTVFLLIFTLGFVAVYAQNFQVNPKIPVAGQKVTISYNPEGSKIEKLTDISCSARIFYSRDNSKAIKIPLTKDGKIYKGEFTPLDSANLALFTFSAGGVVDENQDGYFIGFYKNNKETPMSKFLTGYMYSGIGRSLAKMRTDYGKAVVNFDQAFAADPALKTKYLNNWLSAQFLEDNEKGTKLIKEQLTALNKNAPSESNYIKIASMHSILKDKKGMDSVYNIIHTKFPTGNYAYSMAANAIFAEKDVALKEQKLNALISTFKLDPTSVQDQTKLSGLYSNIASAYGLSNNNEKFEMYSDKVVNKNSLASLYNSYAWAGAEKKQNTVFSAKISKKSLDLIQSLKNDPVPAFYDSKEQYINDLNSSYASFADTYAYLLDQLDNHAEALKYQEEAVNLNKFSSSDMNDRYITFLYKNGNADKVQKYAEQFIKDGHGTDEMRENLKKVYKGNSFDSYFNDLEKIAKDNDRAKFMKEVIKMPAPKFSLVNLKGETVSLEKLRGKVVIIDYWATWCGPCIASFPGMQKAVDKYKNDPNVEFLFVNTWQTEDNREEVVKKFMSENPYTFNVLLDTKNKVNPNEFDVISKYNVEGIPTKFIIDGNGDIRFKKIGGSSNVEGTVKELDVMIEIAKGDANKAR